jgi:hypothetical protein
MNADRARKLAVEAAREADRAEADAWSCVSKALAVRWRPRVKGSSIITTGSFVPALVIGAVVVSAVRRRPTDHGRGHGRDVPIRGLLL